MQQKTREELKKYIKGDGIEIGALQNPLNLSGLSVSSIKYVDKLSVKNLRKCYPELNSMPLIDPDILDNGQKLDNIPDNSLNFIIANHLIEHVTNPLGALKNWNKKLKNGGIVFLAVPDMRYTFDSIRDITTLKHLITDYEMNDKQRDLADYVHFNEWVKNIQKKELDDDIQKETDRLFKEKYSIHYHVWQYDNFLEVINYATNVLGISYEIVDYSETIPKQKEFIFILKKGGEIEHVTKESFFESIKNYLKK